MAKEEHHRKGVPYALVPRTYIFKIKRPYWSFSLCCLRIAKSTGRPDGCSDNETLTESCTVIAIVCAAAVLMIVYVYYRRAGTAPDEERVMSESQAIYMREVRQRNREDIEAIVYGHRTRRSSRHW